MIRLYYIKLRFVRSRRVVARKDCSWWRLTEARLPGPAAKKHSFREETKQEGRRGGRAGPAPYGSRRASQLRVPPHARLGSQGSEGGAGARTRAGAPAKNAHFQPSEKRLRCGKPARAAFQQFLEIDPRSGPPRPCATRSLLLGATTARLHFTSDGVKPAPRRAPEEKKGRRGKSFSGALSALVSREA